MVQLLAYFTHGLLHHLRGTVACLLYTRPTSPPTWYGCLLTLHTAYFTAYVVQVLAYFTHGLLHHLRGTVACLLYTRPTRVVADKQPLNGGCCCCCCCYFTCGWLGSRVVSVLDSGAEGPGFKSQPRCCPVTVLGKLFTPILPLFTKQQITRGVMKLMITG